MGAPHPSRKEHAEWAGPVTPKIETHIDVLLPPVLGTDLGVLYEVQVSPPHGDGCVPTDREERRRRVSMRTGMAMALGEDDDDNQSG